MPDKFPLVTVIIPCLNELAYIAGCLDSIVANDYPKENLEILIIDGMSDDGTRTIIDEYLKEYFFIRMIDNPCKVKPVALNTGIRHSQGDIIVRMDAHAVYESDYIFTSVQYLEACGADNVGGIRKTLPGSDTIIAKAIAHSISHPFAAGNAIYRVGSNEVKWVDTVFGGCYPKRVFEQIGLFNEVLVRGQDREFNARLRRAGGKILLVPDIVCSYYARDKFSEFVFWIFEGGLTPFYISRIVQEPVFSWRNFIPLTFVLILLFSFTLSLVFSFFYLLLVGIVGVYLLTSIGFSIPIAWKERDFRFILAMVLVFATTHIAYGIGSLVGLVRPVRRDARWSRV